MAIGMRMRPLAVENRPEGYTKCEYLEGEGSQYMKIPVIDEPSDELEVESYAAFTDTTKGVEGKTGGGTTSFFWGINANMLYAGVASYGYSSVKADTNWHSVVLRKAKDGNVFLVDDKTVIKKENTTVSLLENAGYGLWQLSNSSIYPSQSAKKNICQNSTQQ